jgi:hypothetical protein
VLILPEGDHGYREGMPPYVAQPREEKSQGVLRPIVMLSQVSEKRDAQTNTQENPATESDRSEPRMVLALIETVQGLQRGLQVLAEGIKRKVKRKNGLKKLVPDGGDAVPQGKRKLGTSRPSSPRTPLGGYSKTIVLRILGRNRLTREPSPLKIGNHWKRKKFKAPGWNSGRTSSSQEVGRSVRESRCSPHDPFGVGLRRAHDNSRVRRTTQRETGNARRIRNRRKIQRR